MTLFKRIFGKRNWVTIYKNRWEITVRNIFGSSLVNSILNVQVDRERGNYKIFLETGNRTFNLTLKYLEIEGIDEPVQLLKNEGFYS
jgi:hypothetical protein